MVNRPRQKGTAWETTVVNYLNVNGFPYAERRALHGNHDLGDITGIPGVVIECKNHATIDLAGATNELRKAMTNARCSVGAAVIKRRNHAVDHAYAVMPLETLCALLVQAGYAATERTAAT